LPAKPENQATLVQVLNEGTLASMTRKLAVDSLGKPAIGAAGLDALVKAIPKAPSDVALAIAIVLSKSDDGAARFLTEVEAGRAPVRLLVHGYVAPGLAERPEAMRTQVTALTRDLPSENARLDALIAARAMAYGRSRPNLARGKAVFTEQCSSCHKLGNTGGSIGPSLDGLASRGVSRVMEDILDPSRNIDPSFRLSTVSTRQGDPQTVMNVQLQGEQYVMATITGQQVNLPKDQVVSVAPINTSLMPGVFESTLSEDDFFSLVKFLVVPTP
jgi:putative heme-binding domain-containing protein